MDTEEIIKRLKNPRKYNTSQVSVSQSANSAQKAEPGRPVHKKMGMEIIVGGVVVVLFVVTLFFWMSSQKRVENLTAALDPKQLQGLALAEAEFNPNTGVTYVEVQEGADRVASGTLINVGSTLPIISRYNFKTLTPKNYEIIGAAPWALTTNFSSNISDPEIIQYLLANDTMINAFLERPDVAPLLEDPQLLLAFTEDKAAMKEFFTNETVQAVLADEKMVRTVAASRFMSHLLISPSVKYFRNNPKEALAAIEADPYLKQVRQNPNVQAAVRENRYLKDIADVLLQAKASAKPAAASASANTKTPVKTSTKKSAKKTTKASSARKTKK